MRNDDDEDNLPVPITDMVIALTRYVRGSLTHTQFAMLMFIFERTYTWSKTEDEIAASVFTDGLHSLTGQLVTCGLGMSRATVYRVRNELAAKGYISFSEGNSGKSAIYSINHDAVLSHVRDSNVSYMRLARLAGETHSISNTGIVNTGCAPALTREAANTKRNVTETAMPIDAVTKLRDTFAATSVKTHEARTKRKSRLNATALMKIWQDAFMLHFPDEKYFQWRIYEQASFKRAIHTNIPLEIAEEFVIYCVKEWAHIISAYFGWMKQPPLLPAVGFVTKQVDKFFLSFEDAKDPNRQLKGRIKRAPSRTVADEQPIADASEVKKLKAQVQALEGKLGEQQRKETTIKVKRFKKAKRLVTDRAKQSAEFGKWEE